MAASNAIVSRVNPRNGNVVMLLAVLFYPQPVALPSACKVIQMLLGLLHIFFLKMLLTKNHQGNVPLPLHVALSRQSTEVLN